jgi:glycerophosphoryl diester phosphodiesterase
VHLSRDGVVVVHHDITLERTTSLSGPIASRTAGELAHADAGYRFRASRQGADRSGDVSRSAKASPADGGDPAEFPFRGRGASIPTLAAVLERYPDVPIVIELKVNRPEMARAAVKIVREAGAVDRVCIGSFTVHVLREVRRLDPEIATSAAREEVRWALYRSRCRWPVKHVNYDGYQVPEWSGRTRVVSQRFVAHSHAAGLGVQVWSVDAEADAARLLDWGVDALITDRPDIIVPFVRARLAAHA